MTKKKQDLVSRLQDLGSLLIAFSGGVDSTFLSAVAHETLGNDLLAVTVRSAIHPPREIDAATTFAREKGIRHLILDSDEMRLPEFLANGPDRCYHCKKRLFERLLEIAHERGLGHVAHGANRDDLADDRPGFRAAQEAGVVAPLIDAGLKKEEIRLLSRGMGLPTWDKPAMACLASRIPYGEPITVEKLEMVDQAEAFLLKRGFRQVRVRHHGSVARIELDADHFGQVFEPGLKKEIISHFLKIGFTHIALDLEGYRAGSMNRDPGGGKKGRPAP